MKQFALSLVRYDEFSKIKTMINFEGEDLVEILSKLNIQIAMLYRDIVKERELERNMKDDDIPF